MERLEGYILQLKRDGRERFLNTYQHPFLLIVTPEKKGSWSDFHTDSMNVDAITLAAEGQVPGAFGPFARALEKHYGLTREQVEFWDLHEIADREHSNVGDHFVIAFADTAELQRGIRVAVRTSLDHWWQFFDGIERAIDATRH